MKCSKCLYTYDDQNDTCPKCACHSEYVEQLASPIVDTSGMLQYGNSTGQTNLEKPDSHSVWSILSKTFKREISNKSTIAALSTNESTSNSQNSSNSSSSDTNGIDNSQQSLLKCSLNELAQVATKNVEVAGSITTLAAQASMENECKPTTSQSTGLPQANVIAEPNNNISDLFDKSFRELQTIGNSESNVLIDSISEDDQEKILLLFDMFEQYLENPTLESKFVTLQNSTETPLLSSKNLDLEIQKTDRALSAKFINLKESLANVATNKNAQEPSAVNPLLNLPSINKVDLVKPILIDAGFITALGLLLLASFMIVHEPYHWQLVLNYKNLLTADMIAIANWGLCSLLLSTLSYLVFTAFVFGTTPGMKFNRIQTIHSSYREHTDAELIGRSIILTANIYSLAWIYSLWSKRSLCDLATQTIHVKKLTMVK